MGDPDAVLEDLEADEFLADLLAIPDELQRRCRFQVVIDQWVQDPGRGDRPSGRGINMYALRS